MRRPVDYLNNPFSEGTQNITIAGAILVALGWIGTLIRRFSSWIWERIKSIFNDYPVIKKDLAEIKDKLNQIEERQFEDRVIIGEVKTLLTQVEPLYKEINTYFAKHNATRQ